MRILPLGVLAVALAALPITAQAQGSREYFLAHIARNDAPRQLSDADATYYRSLFRAIHSERWADVQRLLCQTTCCSMMARASCCASG